MDPLSVILGFPYRATPQRAAIFDQVRPLVEGLFDFNEVVIMDSGHDRFNRAASRNMIARYAINKMVHVVVICDADSIPDREVLKEAILEAQGDSDLHVPFDTVRVLPYGRFFREPTKYARMRPISTYGPSCGGCYVLRPNLWQTIGGMDERIEGWGFEDQIFLAAVNTFAGGPVYHVGDLTTIDHVRDVSDDHTAQNGDLVDRYHSVEGNQDEFRKVSAGSNGFRPDALKK